MRWRLICVVPVRDLCVTACRSMYRQYEVLPLRAWRAAICLNYHGGGGYKCCIVQYNTCLPMLTAFDMYLGGEEVSLAVHRQHCRSFFLLFSQLFFANSLIPLSWQSPRVASASQLPSYGRSRLCVVDLNTRLSLSAAVARDGLATEQEVALPPVCCCCLLVCHTPFCRLAKHQTSCLYSFHQATCQRR